VLVTELLLPMGNGASQLYRVCFIVVMRAHTSAASLSPFYGAIAVLSVTRCRCCRRRCRGHRCAGGMRKCGVRQ